MYYSLFFSFFYYDCTDQISLVLCFIFTVSPLFLDDSDEEERRLLTKEEEDIDILHSWMEVGGQPALPEGKAQGLLAEVSKSSCSPFCFDLLSISLMICMCGLSLAISSFSFQGCETAPEC